MRSARRNDTIMKRGSAVLEFTLIVTLVLLPLLVGTADFALYVNARHVMVRAANEGVMQAIHGEDPAPRVLEFVSRAGLSAAHTSVQLDADAAVPVTGTRLTLTVVHEVQGLIVSPMVPALEKLTQVTVTAVGRHV